MIAYALQRKLHPLAIRRRQWRVGRGLAWFWLAASMAGLLALLLGRWAGIASPNLVWGLVSVTAAALLVVWYRLRSWDPDWRALAREIERQNPELRALLLTAVQQQPDPRTGRLNYLQERVVDAAIEESRRHDWAGAIPWHQWLGMRLAPWVAMGLWVLLLAKFPTHGSPALAARTGPEITVTPGDATIERGSGLVVLARFAGRLPTAVTLVIGSSTNPVQRLSLARNLDDPEFGGSLIDVQSNVVYRIEYDGHATRDYTVRVFEYPRVERIDAQIEYPAYTGLAEKRIPDTRRVSAVEGSRLTLAVQLNKPVASARLVGKDKSIVALSVQPQLSTVALTNFLVSSSQIYDLQLRDPEGRSNRISTSFVVTALTNRPPQIKLTAPLGDQRVSALEEIQFRGEASDDFGLKAYGLAYTVAGKETQTLTLGQNSASLETRKFQYLLALESLQLQPGQLISYYLWAEDLGADGRPRRVTGDLFFAEIRPFDEVFRQSQSAARDSSASSNEESGESGGSGQNASVRLVELQKQIILATWSLQRQDLGGKPSTQYLKDAPVVRQSQAQALDQAREAKTRATDPKSQAAYDQVEESMNQALEQLTKATNSPAALPSALTHEQAAYQALAKLQAREFEVAQGQGRRGNRSGNRGQQQQLQQLQMNVTQNRYETERQAARPTTPQKAGETQIQNRLKELSQRQQDVNERLQELQTALQEARTATDREEIRRRLQRLRDEERQMLADMDEMRQQLDRAENQAQAANTRQQLDQTRADMERAAEALRNESVPQALTSGVRAQRQLQQMRDEMRQQGAGQMAEDLRQLRSDARSLAQKQDALDTQLREMNQPRQKTLRPSADRTNLVEQLTQQQNALTNLQERATDITRQAEAGEPQLAKRLYDTLRQSQQEGIDNLLKLSAEMLRRSFTPQATQLEQRAREGINRFRGGIEQAAEVVLGDEAEVLRQARKELEDLGQQVQREAVRYQSNDVANLVSNGSSGPTNASGTNSDWLSLLAGGNSRSNGLASGQGQRARLGSTNQPGGGNQSGQPRTAQNTRNQRGGPNANPGRNNTSRLEGGIEGGFEGGSLTGGSQTNAGPLTGRDFIQWSDRLRDVADMLDFPDWRNEVSRIRDRAQALRVEFKRSGELPKWPLVNLQIVAPLAEVRARIQEELARRENQEGLAPLDRDPVPQRYSELVRRYYEQLGRDR